MTQDRSLDCLHAWVRGASAGITINNVLPGFTGTERLTSPQQTIVAAVCCLASSDGSFVRGQSLSVDGGRMNSI